MVEDAIDFETFTQLYDLNRADPRVTVRPILELISDEFLRMGDSNTLEGIMFDRGWTARELNRELFKRKVVLSYPNELPLATSLARSGLASLRKRFPSQFGTLYVTDVQRDSSALLGSGLVHSSPELEQRALPSLLQPSC